MIIKYWLQLHEKQLLQKWQGIVLSKHLQKLWQEFNGLYIIRGISMIMETRRIYTSLIFICTYY
jgi:hypothetical protein